MKKIVKISTSLVFLIITISLPILVCTKAPFGKCEFTIKKSTNATSFKKLAEITEGNLLDTIISFANETFKIAPKVIYLNDQIEQDDFINWINTLSCIYNWLETNKKKHYLSDMTSFYTISNFIYAIAKLTDNEKKLHEKGIQTKLKQLIEINKNAVFAIDKSTSNSSKWKNSVGTTSKLKPLIEKYKAYLESYKESKEAENTYFKTRIENASPEDLQEYADELEQIIYRLQLTKSLVIFDPKLLALSKFAQNFLKYIITAYGNGLYYLSKGFLDKYELSKDLPSKTLFIISQRLFRVLYKLLNKE